ncbi:MAG: glycosyltransferase, partial [Bacteroidota bacterium]
MDVSIIIVNYNVKHFLEQCLLSVEKALQFVEGEVIVVDNNSVDGSQQMLRDKFGDRIIFIENKDNPGFSKANNQGIKIAQGRYVLLLNPDTVVEEQTFRKCVDFMDERPKSGALGVKMIDGEGQFLPESKRSLPTPWVSFYKIFGLAKLFHKSKKFGQYHLTYLDKEENHPIEILSGAFMFMRSEALEKIGYLDEDFFMYGEDIDLSYRFIKAGYQNYYLADTQIIHYKGESTKKGSLNYVKVFYQAMIIFAQKHFGGSRKRLFIASIRLAVYMRALAAILHRVVKRFGFPLMEMLLIFLTTFGVKRYWEHYVKYIEGGAYPDEFTFLYIPAYALVFVVFLWMAGAYQKPFKLRPLVMAPLWAFVAIATITYMFDPIRNFSRAIVGLSAIFTMVLTMATRGLINWREHGTFFFTESRSKRVAIIGQGEDLLRVVDLIRAELDYPVEIVGLVNL